MMRCSRCNAELSEWELRKAADCNAAPCWCDGVPTGIFRTLANIAYAELCHTGLKQPVRIHDVIRFISHECSMNPRRSINVALSQDRRFCWGGRALYGLARHGLIPGARSLAEAAYAILLAAPRQLHFEEVDFVLEQFNYRFNSDSLVHLLRGYTSNRWNLGFRTDSRNRVSVNTGRDARHEYNRNVRVCPTHAAFDTWVNDHLAPKVERTLEDRTRRLVDLGCHKVQIAGDRFAWSQQELSPVRAKGP